MLNKYSIFRVLDYASNGLECLCSIIGCVMAVATGVTVPLHIHYTGVIVESLVSNTQNAKDVIGQDVHRYMVISCILGAVTFVCTYVAVILFNHASASQIYQIRLTVFRAVFNKDVGWFDDHEPDEIACGMTETISQLQESIGDKIVTHIYYVATIFSLIMYAIVRGTYLASISLLGPIVALCIMKLLSACTVPYAKRIQKTYDAAAATAEEAFRLIRTVISFNGQQNEAIRYARQLRSARTMAKSKQVIDGVVRGLILGITFTILAASLWLGTTLVLQDRNKDIVTTDYSVGTMFSICLSAMVFFIICSSLSPIDDSIGMATRSADKILAIVDHQPTINPPDRFAFIPRTIQGLIQFRNIAFRYPDRTDVRILNHVNFSVRPGETVALVGVSGCGKSTCVRLLQRFYDPDEGEVYLDDTDIREFDVNWLRSHMGVVDREPVLFATSIYENIAYGNVRASTYEIEFAARMADAHDFIMRLPRGYHTMIGDNEVHLTVGQKQKITIARALVRSPRIVVLDEVLSDLDAVSAAKIQDALQKSVRAIIIVAQRLSTIRNVDKIVVLHEGKVVEIGTHSELMLLKGHYYAMVPEQAADGSIDENPSQSVTTPETYSEHVMPDAGQVSIREVIRLMHPDLAYIMIASLCTLITSCVQPLFGMIFGYIIAHLAHQDDANVRRFNNEDCMIFASLAIGFGFGIMLEVCTTESASANFKHRLSARAFHSMLRQDMAWFDDKHYRPSTLSSRLSAYTSFNAWTTVQSVTTIVRALGSLFVSLTIGLCHSWQMGLVAVTIAPVIIGVSLVEFRFTGQSNVPHAEALDASDRFTAEAVSNARTVISFGLQKLFYAKYMELLQPTLADAKLTHIRGIVFGAARCMCMFVVSVGFVAGGRLLAAGMVTSRDILVVTLSLLMASLSICQAIPHAPNILRSFDQDSDMSRIIKRRPLIEDPPGRFLRRQLKPRGNINFEGIHFSYPSHPAKQVLNGFHIDVRPGQSVALVGPSGGGKSTAMLLLQRFYDPNKGIVWLDGRHMLLLNVANIRSMISIVSHKPSLFDRTIGENIAYGDTSRRVYREEIIRAAKQANIHRFVLSLRLGYDTRVGSMGTKLSPGQMRCIAIARALVRRPKVLVLDEATSGLDSKDEALVQAALEAASKGRTCITITQRLGTIVGSDMIFVVKDGKVVERGTHSQLLEQNGMYCKLYALQSRDAQR